jgi:hypothetical protein
MVTRDRRLLEQIIKQWAQDHTAEYEIADYEATEEALERTQGHFTWCVQEGHVTIDLLSLADRLELFLENRRKRKHPDGMLCSKCKSFYEFAEPNQSDGSMICYSCRNNPYR